jgi:UDP-N-acetylmuramoyl-tripeptide--D-alanyl-D-alanine ligase
MPGRHAVTDALLALAVAELLGVSAAEAVRGLTSVGPGSLRGELRRLGGLTLIVDCYNANPPSVRAALALLEGHRASRRVAVLGTMLELGDATERLHRDVLRDALSRDLDLIVATGAFSDAAIEHAASPRVLSAPDWREAYPPLKKRLGGDEVVLLKASRGIGMEGIVALLEADFGPRREA